jgi:imidazolonepropionase-like amidohydrolase
MLAAGVNVVVGTDSTASSPDLNLVDDLRLLRRIAPDMPAEAIWQLVTARAAAALAMASCVGTLTPGKRADAAWLPISGTSPLETILYEPILPSSIWIAGQLVTFPEPGDHLR